MIAADIRNQYKATIGIECHVQLKTATKLFAAVGNDAREAAAEHTGQPHLFWPAGRPAGA